ncbi:hypothetical protein ACH3WN_20600 [Streptomyces albogriseolus]|uniref:hypothetical protein n=1 Tax=Streptomyces albogriseolus TaxID=1887 RepID=UPI0037A464F2
MNGIHERRAASSGGLVAGAGRAVTAPGARHPWTRYVPCDAVERDVPRSAGEIARVVTEDAGGPG